MALEKALPHIQCDLDLVFTREDLTEIKDTVLPNKVLPKLVLLPPMGSLCWLRTVVWYPRRLPFSRLCTSPIQTPGAPLRFCAMHS